MAAAIRVSGKPSGKTLGLIFAPILGIVAFGVLYPRLHSPAQTRPAGQIDWGAMRGYELSVARKYPHVRRGYEMALSRDRSQLAYLDRRIAGTSDPEMRRGLEQQRVMVTSGISVVEQILDHFPAESKH